jgi:hypothetical protein
MTTNLSQNIEKKNVLCKHLVDGTMICTYTECFFAHSLEQWNVPQCKFPRCRDIFRNKEGKILNNKFSVKICNRQHIGETYENMLERCGLNHLVGKKVESKPKHVLICSPSSLGEIFVKKKVTSTPKKVKKTESVCKKWETLSDEEMKEYDVTYITCRTCKHIVRPRSVHTNSPYGDYECIKCNNGINISHFCLNCKIENLY